MDTFYEALSLYRRRKFEKSALLCTELLDKNPYDQAAWTLKMKALTAQVMVDDIEAEEEGIADSLLDTETIAQAARPGTSLRTAPAATAAGLRPRASTGRAVSGMVRPATQSGLGTSLENALKTPRTARSARPVTTHAARTLRLGTASMMTQPDGPFIQVSRLNMSKYASLEGIAKPLFLYIFYHENDVRNALDLAVEATKAAQFKDWWWKVALGKCYALLGLVRDAEQQFRSALKQVPTVDAFLRLCSIYTKLDQPLNVLEVCNAALKVFPNEVTLQTEIARILEALNNIPTSVKYYREVLTEEAMNVEAIACIAVNYFYSDQPEVALCFYRRLLQMGLYNAELFNNIGLCCYYAQHYDMVVNCFERALSLAIDETAADVWYNIAHVAIGVGDLMVAIQCLRLCISIDSNHAAAYNNLGVLLNKKGQTRDAYGYFIASQNLGSYLFEPFYNHSLLSKNAGDLQTSYNTVQKSLKVYTNHMPSKDILNSLEKYFKNI
ncbi:tetratricopeptide repeat protein 8 isoform X1 [Halyomorpha halys]|uniref:tetratricopeptide repeat protein 8 isoform X1 n=1 Tax=Halyomorpha halys TaxID=286706 RepID=UPI0006D50E5B|nr:tetratricopeptide repeat protein 8 isoform X1 [Halyomorpha halys]